MSPKTKNYGFLEKSADTYTTPPKTHKGTSSGSDGYCTVCLCFLPIYSGRQVRWMYKPGSNRKKVTHDLAVYNATYCTTYSCSFSEPKFFHGTPPSTEHLVWSHIQQEYGSTGYGCQSCSWSAEQRKNIFPCPRSRLRIWSRETGSAVPSRVSLFISIPRLNLVLTCGNFRGRLHILRIYLKPPYAIGPVPSLLGHAIAYRWRSLPRVRRHRVSKRQGSSERVLPWQVTMCVCVCFLPIHSGLQWTYQPGSHRKKVTQDFPSTFFLRCLP